MWMNCQPQFFFLSFHNTIEQMSEHFLTIPDDIVNTKMFAKMKSHCEQRRHDDIWVEETN